MAQRPRTRVCPGIMHSAPPAPIPALVLARQPEATLPDPVPPSISMPPSSPMPDPVPPSRLSPAVCILGIDNGAGLSRDREILADAFGEEGWDVVLFDPLDKNTIPPPVDLTVHLESPATHLLGLAQKDILVPNPEWWAAMWTPHLARLSLWAWTKTEDSARIFQGLGAQVERIGFRSRDHYDPTVPRKRAFLHIGGASSLKNTALLISCWREDWPHLTVVTLRQDCHPHQNVTVLRHVSEEELRCLQNAHLFHIYPSRYEGFGHAQWEGLSCGAVVFVTQGPSFADCEAFLRIQPVTEVHPQAGELKLVVEHVATAESIAVTVSRAQALSDEETRQISERSRSAWEKNAGLFRERFHAVFSGSAHQSAPVRRKVLSIHSAFERCGIREYGRQLDEALRAQGAEVLAFTHDQVDTIVGALGPGMDVLVHYENALIRPRFFHVLQKAKGIGGKIVFCCHWFGRTVLKDYRSMVDRFVVHRPYDGLATENVIEIPLACPVYTTGDRAALRREYGLPEGKVIVTTIGFLVRWKRIPEVLDAMLAKGVDDLFLQVLTPLSFQGDQTDEAPKVRRVLSHHDPASVRTFFSTDFRSEEEMLGRLCASDIGFLYHAQDTGSVSAATKQFVSVRTPLVVTNSTHARDLKQGIHRVEGYEMEDVVDAVVSLVKSKEKRESLQCGMEAEYRRLNMHEVARRYLDLFKELQ